ncbi:MAG: Fic family protein [Candidatus Paceibacterota bacterium]
MQKRRIIPTTKTNLRHLWLEKLGGIETVSVRNKEWITLLTEDTRNSLMIEGHFITRADLKEAIENPKYSKNGYKILGYFDAAVACYELAFQQYRSKEFRLTKAIIRQIHSMMFRGDPNFPYSPGEWRKGPIEITGSKVKTDDSFGIEDDIEKLIDIVNRPEEDLIKKIAVVHDMFEQIHPFPDGNGRVGRILINFILVGHGLPNIAIKGSDQNKKIYISALEEADPIVADILHGNTKKDVFSKPLIQLEELLNRSLAIAMDVIICNRYNKIKALIPLSEIAKDLGKSALGIRVACSQKKIICANIDGVMKTHPDLFNPPS